MASRARIKTGLKKESIAKYKRNLKAEGIAAKNQRRGTLSMNGAVAASRPSNQKGKNSKTPRNKDFPNLNREGRRGLIYKNKLSSLLGAITRLRYDMIGAGIKPPVMPRFRSPKFLSGYYSQLIALSLQEI